MTTTFQTSQSGETRRRRTTSSRGSSACSSKAVALVRLTYLTWHRVRNGFTVQSLFKRPTWSPSIDMILRKSSKRRRDVYWMTRQASWRQSHRWRCCVVPTLSPCQFRWLLASASKAASCSEKTTLLSMFTLYAKESSRWFEECNCQKRSTRRRKLPRLSLILSSLATSRARWWKGMVSCPRSSTALALLVLAKSLDWRRQC